VGKIFAEIDDALRAFIAGQHVFFVATAPLSSEGHVNLSPKGLDCLRILGPRQLAYLDLTGSGVETIAHVRENRRLTIMFCAFTGAPRILRLYGRARTVEPGNAEWGTLARRFPDHSGTRSIITLDIERIADSCGYAVPLYDYVGERTQLTGWAERKGPEGLAEYRAEKNRTSIDGLPGLRNLV
jgi:hypothetical protein